MLTSPARGPAGNNTTGRPAGDIVPRGFQKAKLGQFTPEQMDLYQQLFGNLGQDSQLAGIARGDEGAFEQMEAPAWRQFQQQQGQLASRFSGMQPGQMSSTKGSSFKNAAGQLGSDFAMNLQAQRQGLMRQALDDLMGYSNTLLNQRPYSTSLVENQQKQQQPGFWGQLGQGALALGGGFLGGPGGAAVGNFLGNQMFNNGGMSSGSLSSGGSRGMY